MAVEHGYMPLGKFSSARDDILHFMCINDWASESTGNSTDWNVYVWQISNDPADVQQSNTETASLLEQWFEFNPEVTDSPELREELVGHFLVTESCGGHVDVAKYETEKEMLDDYDEIERDYFEWDGQFDD
jgi:hypothetical protein